MILSLNWPLDKLKQLCYSERMKYHNKQYFLKKLKDAGLSSDYRWILKMEKLGKLTCPRNPTTNWRMFTDLQIDAIIDAFSPGGKGEWHFKN